MGLIVKRPIANGAWGAGSSPSGYADRYFERAEMMRALGPLPEVPEHRILLALGFAWANPAPDTFIVGTRNPVHMQTNLDWVQSALPISGAAVAELERRFERFADEHDWHQLS